MKTASTLTKSQFVSKEPVSPSRIRKIKKDPLTLDDLIKTRKKKEVIAKKMNFVSNVEEGIY